MSATGVPGMILISREIRNFRAEYRLTRDSFEARVGVLEDKLLNAMTDLPEKIGDVVFQRVQVKGAKTWSLSELRGVIKEVMSESHTLIDVASQLTKLNESNQIMMEKLNILSSGNGATGSSSQSGEGQLWPIAHANISTPENFKFPSYNTAIMWQLWFFGDRSKGICPLKNVAPSTHLTEHVCKTNCSRTKKVMRKLLSICVADELISSASDVTISNYSTLFDKCYPKLIAACYGAEAAEVHRRNDLNINTLAQRLIVMERKNKNQQKK